MRSVHDAASREACIRSRTAYLGMSEVRVEVARTPGRLAASDPSRTTAHAPAEAGLAKRKAGSGVIAESIASCVAAIAADAVGRSMLLRRWYCTVERDCCVKCATGASTTVGGSALLLQLPSSSKLRLGDMHSAAQRQAESQLNNLPRVLRVPDDKGPDMAGEAENFSHAFCRRCRVAGGHQVQWRLSSPSFGAQRAHRYLTGTTHVGCAANCAVRQASMHA